jgi:hypothetical protein
MMVKRTWTGGIAFAAALFMVAGLLAELAGLISPVTYEVLLVASFPVFVICLGLWWMAREHEGDIPFIGY